MERKGCLITSLDFELYWGVCASRSLSQYKDNITGGRTAIPELLALFERHGIHATWAAVGFIFAENAGDAERYFPAASERPSYDDKAASSYRCFAGLEKGEARADCFFAPSLIGTIAECEGQEIGSHTFSHYYCRESGQTAAQFRADLKAAGEIARDKGFAVSTLVFPRNQSEPEYVRAAADAGFTAFRGEENDWIHNRVSFLRRMLNLTDVYLPLTGQGGFIPEKEYGIWNITGSRMYKPYFRPLAFLERLKLRRIKKQMLHAAKKRLAFHLWWHPHNIGVMTEFHLKQLEEIFAYFDELKEKYGMTSMNIREAAAYYSEE